LTIKQLAHLHLLVIRRMKKNLALIYGGKSTEHEISIRSARNIAAAIDSTLFHTTYIGVAKDGSWYLKNLQALNEEDVVQPNSSLIHLAPGQENPLICSASSIDKLDAAFSIIHGTAGEDGTIQAILKTLEIPFVGPGVLSSAVCLDKVVTKRLLTKANIANAPYVSIGSIEELDVESVAVTLKFPVYVKPPNLGSSVGITKVSTPDKLKAAVKEAFKYDHKVLIEEGIVGRELECAILGNKNPKASTVGEVLTSQSHDFYDYEAKYLDADGSTTIIPAKLTDEQMSKVQRVALDTYTTLECEGMARVDVFLLEDDRILVNEVNTAPGFTSISMYPKLWGESGIDYTALITQLVELGIERFNREKQKITTI
jgi:D-alanine-D-alanine ligase